MTIHAVGPTTALPVVALIDGLTRSGKSLLGPIMSSFDRVEIERLEPDLEWIGDLWHLGRIERDGAVAFLRLAVNRLNYEGMIGRNTNFRVGDHSSVWKSPRPWLHIRRLVMDERRPLIERLSQERPIFQNMVHHQLMNFDLFHEAFGNHLRMIEMIRDPVDLVDSWMRKQKGVLIGHDPLISMVFIDWNGRNLPWYAAGWEQEYLDSSPLDRVIRLVAVKWRLLLDCWRRLAPPQLSRLLLVPLEHFVERPAPYLERLCEFVDTVTTRHTTDALRQQRCPRVYDRAERDRALSRMQGEAGNAARTALDEMVQEHSNVVRQIAL